VMRNFTALYIFKLNNSYSGIEQIIKNYSFKKQLSSNVERICHLIICVCYLRSEPAVAFAPLAILLLWTNYMILLFQLPQLSNYFDMYVSVFKQFLKLFIAFFALIIGYAIAFYMISLNMKDDIGPLTALSKTVAMMAGEYEFNDLFKNSDNNWTSRIAKIIFMTFVVSITIILVNLLIGVVIQDDNENKKSAATSKIIRKVELLETLEVTSHFIKRIKVYCLSKIRRNDVFQPLHDVHRFEKYFKVPRVGYFKKILLQDAYKLALKREETDLNNEGNI
jgi:hypothetical protein